MMCVPFLPNGDGRVVFASEVFPSSMRSCLSSSFYHLIIPSFISGKVCIARIYAYILQQGSLADISHNRGNTSRIDSVARAKGLKS